MLNLSAEVIEQILSPAEIIEVVKSGIINFESGLYDVPTRMHLERPKITNLVMPAIGEQYFCTKLVSVVPDNPKRNLPTIVGTVILSKLETGETVALLDAPMITALRTAAIGALGFSIITPKTTEKIGIIGLGVQGIWQTIFACAIGNIKQVYCYSRSPSKFDAYKKKVLEKCPGLEITFCKNGDEVVRNSSVIYTCTNSPNPVFSDKEKLVQGKRFISIGSFKKNMQELPNIIYKNADLLLIDAPSAIHEVGDVINTIKNGYLEKHQIFTIGKVFTKDKKIEHSQNIVFKSVGMAAFDLALAVAVYEQAFSNRNSQPA